MYAFKSISDLSSVISKNINKIPKDVDLIVGVPRSGMLPASMMALYLNTPLTDVYSYADDRPLKSGQTRRVKKNSLEFCKQAKHILIVDDSISSGSSMKKVKEVLEKITNKVKVTYCCIYGVYEAASSVDIIFEYVPLPRIFEWNIFHHLTVNFMCFDIDGVLCKDPTPEQNDDGEEYRRFILNAEPLFLPTQKIRSLVTSRLEKYREETKVWLEKHGVEYENLYMLDLPDAETRRKLGVHAKFKSSVYGRDIVSTLFVESELRQAIEISNSTGKDVFCTEIMALVMPGRDVYSQINLHKTKSKYFIYRLIRYIKRKVLKNSLFSKH